MTPTDLQAALPTGWVVVDPNPSDEDIEFDVLRDGVLVARVGCWHEGTVAVRRLVNGHLASGIVCAESPQAVAGILGTED